MADEEITPPSPPLPKRGTYNIDFDALDDSINPFASSKSLGSSPPIKSAAPVSYDNLDDIVDPFKPRSAISSSPPGGSSSLAREDEFPPPPPPELLDEVEDPFKSTSKVASSPPGSPKVISQNNNIKDSGFSDMSSSCDVIPAEAAEVNASTNPGEEETKQNVTPKSVLYPFFAL